MKLSEVKTAAQYGKDAHQLIIPPKWLNQNSGSMYSTALDKEEQGNKIRLLVIATGGSRVFTKWLPASTSVELAPYHMSGDRQAHIGHQAGTTLTSSC